MSKASEWAKLGDAAQFPKPEFEHFFDWPLDKAAIHQVRNRPVLVITHGYLEARDALKFAKWINDTFGEGRATGREG